MDSLVCSICGAEELVPKYTPPFTCPVCGRVNSVYVNGRLAHGHEAPGSIPPQTDAHMVTTGIKMPRYLLHRVQVAADERCLGRNLLIRMLIEQGLDRLIPIEQLTREKEKEKEDEQSEAGNLGGNGVFGRYLHGSGMYTPKSEPHAPGSTTSVPGGSDRPDPEGFGVCLDLSCPTDSAPTEVPAEGDRDPDRRLDQPG